MVVQDTSSSAQQNELIMFVIEEMTNQVDKYQRKVHALYYDNTIVKQHVVLSVIDTEKTLKLVEESRLKIYAKQNDLIVQEKKVNIAPINYVPLNKLSEHFDKHFVPQKQLFTAQAFWLPISKPVSDIPPVQPEPFLKKIPYELPNWS
ncbi:hypothetical protein Tco_0923407 [Tanacetum coccineum]|uniref:Uncharacterized protein n=1 Tax=Tanacetum coccineum TaxID=301880 RepID=A0ABQ5D3B5_9ASTR